MDSFICILVVEKESIEDFPPRYADLPKSNMSNLLAGITDVFAFYIEVYST